MGKVVIAKKERRGKVIEIMGCDGVDDAPAEVAVEKPAPKTEKGVVDVVVARDGKKIEIMGDIAATEVAPAPKAKKKAIKK